MRRGPCPPLPLLPPPPSTRMSAAAGNTTSTSTVKMSSTISHPTAICPCVGVEHVVVGQHAHQHDGARHRDRDAEHHPFRSSASRAPSPPRFPARVATAICPDRARDGDLLHGQQITQIEVRTPRRTSTARRRSPRTAAPSPDRRRTPGVYGPSTIPASRYPTIGESRSFSVISPKTSAASRPTGEVDQRVRRASRSCRGR